MQTIPPPGPHGDDAIRVAAALGIEVEHLLDLSVTTNPLAPDASLVISKHLESLKHYPDATTATSAMADAIGVSEDMLLLTNGGAEAIALVAQDLSAGHVIQPDFSVYERHLQHHGEGRWASNPNNPTGLLADESATAAVWDEAFYGLATGEWTRGDAGVALGSLTKILRCPGLRVGYVLSRDTDLIGRLRSQQPKWSVNGLVCASLPDLLSTVELSRWSLELAELRTRLTGVLASHGLFAKPSDANFVLVPEAGGLRDALILQRILIRDCASFGLDGHVRVAVPDEAGLHRLRVALEQINDSWSAR